MNHSEETPAPAEQESTSPNLGEKISPEMNATLHAVQEEDNAAQAEPIQGDESEPPTPEQIAEIKEALAEATGESVEAEDDKSAEEIAGLKDQLIRTVAEMENLRKRTERELSDARKYAVTGFARDLVNVVENLQLALQNIPAEDRKNDEKLENLAQGVEMTANELLRVFEGNGIVRIDPKGEKFNHNHHQAVAHIEDAEATPGHVVQVLQAGYIIHDRLLRPAMVTVAKGGNKTESVNTEA